MSPAIGKIRKYNDRYVVFFDWGCPYSEEAIKLLTASKLPYRSYEISGFSTLPDLVGYFSQKDIQKEVGYSPSHKTKPIVFYKGQFIGGCSELKKHLQQDL